MTSEGMGEMFEGDFAEMCAKFFLLMLMGWPSGGYGVRRPATDIINFPLGQFGSCNNFKGKNVDGVVSL